MKRTRIIALALFAGLAFGVSLSRANDQPPAATPPAVAPANNTGTAVEPAAGCMPDGSCCGHGDCAHAAASADKPANGAAAGGNATGSNAESATGGCPCGKMKKKAM
jgi:hypothetical protein